MKVKGHNPFQEGNMFLTNMVWSVRGGSEKMQNNQHHTFNLPPPPKKIKSRIRLEI